MISARDISWGPSCLPVLLPDRQQRTAQHGQPRALCSAGCVLFNVNAMQFHVTILCLSSCNGPRSATKKHGFQNIKGVFSHCSGAFSVENDCVHSRTACECRKFSSVATLKVLFFLMVPCFFALQVVFVFVPLARFWDFRKCFHAHKWAGACFSLYDIGQTGATSRPLPECAPRSGRDTRTPCPRWKPHSAPRQECPVRNPCPPAQRPASAPADGTQHKSPPGIPRRTGFFVLPHAEMFAHPPAIIPRSATPPAVWPRPEVPHIIQQPRSRRINAHRGQCFKFFCVVRCPPDVQRRKRLIFPPPFQIPQPQQFPTRWVSLGIVVHHLCHHTGLLHPGPGLVPAPQRVPVLPKPAPDGPPLLLGHGCTPLSTVPPGRPCPRAGPPPAL